MKNTNVKVINLTPHAITVVRGTSDGGLETFAVYEPSGRMARCTSKTVQTGIQWNPNHQDCFWRRSDCGR